MRPIRLLLASVLGMTAFAFQAQAGSCLGDPVITLGVVTSTACEIGSTNNDKLGPPLQVNADSMFGFTDWLFAEKALDPLEPVKIDIGLMAIGGSLGEGMGGAWLIDNIWPTVSHIMLVLQLIRHRLPLTCGREGTLNPFHLSFTEIHDFRPPFI